MACRESSNRKFYTFKENKSELTLENTDEVESLRIIVDGCEINDEGVRCDFLHIAKDIEIYIELKGQDLLHALEQIKRTMMLLSQNYQKKKKVSYIICTRSPLSSTEIQNLDIMFRKKYNSKLIIKSSPYKDKY